MKIRFLVLLILAALPASCFAQGIGELLGWKFNHAPGIKTYSDENGERITGWPTSELGPAPSQATIDSWKPDYLAAMEAKAKQKRIDESNIELARWVEYMTVVLVSKGIVLRGEIPQSVKDAINARRAERGEAPF